MGPAEDIAELAGCRDTDDPFGPPVHIAAVAGHNTHLRLLAVDIAAHVGNHRSVVDRTSLATDRSRTEVVVVGRRSLVDLERESHRVPAMARRNLAVVSSLAGHTVLEELVTGSHHIVEEVRHTAVGRIGLAAGRIGCCSRTYQIAV